MKLVMDIKKNPHENLYLILESHIMFKQDSLVDLQCIDKEVNFEVDILNKCALEILSDPI